MPSLSSVARSMHKIPACRKDREYFETLLAGPYVKVERIISFGQATPEGQWLRQSKDEWVMLVSGSATLGFWRTRIRVMKPGDYLLIPAGMPHRVVRTHPRKPTIWFALHYDRSGRKCAIIK